MELQVQWNNIPENNLNIRKYGTYCIRVFYLHNCLLGGFNCVIFRMLKGFKRRMKSYWQNNKLILFEKCLKCLLSIGILNLQKVLIWPQVICNKLCESFEFSDFESFSFVFSPKFFSYHFLTQINEIEIRRKFCVFWYPIFLILNAHAQKMKPFQIFCC